MGGATNCPETPRQKMIGMMYIVLTALLAMNVSASILDGFAMVEDSLKINTKGAENRNENLYGKFEDLAGQNPAKVGEWLDKAKQVRAKADKLYKDLDALKLQIVRAGPDGSSATLEHYLAKDNLDAAGYVAMDKSAGGLGQGKIIKKAINEYKDFLITFVKSDPAKIAQLQKTFNTEDRKASHGDGKKPWEIAAFEMMPLAAVTTILSKIQTDVRNSEGEIITFLKSQVDAEDFRVNKIEALVIPNSKYIIQGGKYSAQIVLAASDSTEKPEVYIGGDADMNGGTLVEGGLLERSGTAIGEQQFKGYIRVKSPVGYRKYAYQDSYNVGAPSATISADKMNVFYAGIPNEVSVSVPGVPASAITATMTGGSLIKQPKGGWIAKPAKVGQECVITVMAKIEDKNQKMGSKNFRVKMLPPPVAYIPYKDDAGNTMKYKGSEKIKKQFLLDITNLKAELNDADIEAKFDVLSFELNITEAMGTSVEASSGANFTSRQLAYIKKLSKGKKFFISGVIAKGPDGVERKLPPMEVIVN